MKTRHSAFVAAVAAMIVALSLVACRGAQRAPEPVLPVSPTAALGLTPAGTITPAVVVAETPTVPAPPARTPTALPQTTAGPQPTAVAG